MMIAHAIRKVKRILKHDAQAASRQRSSAFPLGSNPKGVDLAGISASIAPLSLSPSALDRSAEEPGFVNPSATGRLKP